MNKEPLHYDQHGVLQGDVYPLEPDNDLAWYKQQYEERCQHALDLEQQAQALRLLVARLAPDDPTYAEFFDGSSVCFFCGEPCSVEHPTAKPCVWMDARTYLRQCKIK